MSWEDVRQCYAYDKCLIYKQQILAFLRKICIKTIVASEIFLHLTLGQAAVKALSTYSYETVRLIGCISICRPIRFTETNEPHQPLISFGLQGNLSMNHLALNVTKLEVLGIKLWVIEVVELKFDIYFNKL